MNANDTQLHQSYATVNYQYAPPSTVKESVLNGYPLPNMPRLFYMKTLWKLNNETLNVWTHLITGIYFIWLLHRYSQEMNILENWPVLLIILSSLSVTFCSAAAHTFHSRSEFDHCVWMLVDFFGIIMFSFGSTVVHFFACSELSYYLRFGYWNLAVLTFNCCFVYVFLSFTKRPSKGLSKGHVIRVSSLAYGYSYGIAPILHRFFVSGFSESSIDLHVMSILFMILAPLLYITNKPQCYSPGTFDLIGHNHQIFHICISMMLYCDILAVHNDVVSANGHWKKLKDQGDHPSLYDIIVFSTFLMIWCLLIGLYTIHNVRKHLTKED